MNATATSGRPRVDVVREPNYGRITQVIGSTFDAEFPEHRLPAIYNAVKIQEQVKGL
ncbi:MAG TPA: hypothetical protein PL064_08270, partial [Thermogutta sp.]|nr:hypothetical protein [Thermogutta sp.]